MFPTLFSVLPLHWCHKWNSAPSVLERKGATLASRTDGTGTPVALLRTKKRGSGARMGSKGTKRGSRRAWWEDIARAGSKDAWMTSGKNLPLVHSGSLVPFTVGLP